MFACLSPHILDICQNSSNAGADLIRITLSVSEAYLVLQIEDNGKGVLEEDFDKISDPFYTTKPSGKTGLGLSLLKEAALAAKGSFKMAPAKEHGLIITAKFSTCSPNCLSLGCLKKDVCAVLLFENRPDIVFEFRSKSCNVKLDTRDAINEGFDYLLKWKYAMGFFKQNEIMFKIISYGTQFFRNKEENNEN